MDTVIYHNGDLLQFEGIEAIDVVVDGNSTFFRLSDGIEGNSEFGSGQILAELHNVFVFQLDQ